jgi:hypothetical protein
MAPAAPAVRCLLPKSMNEDNVMLDVETGKPPCVCLETPDSVRLLHESLSVGDFSGFG